MATARLNPAISVFRCPGCRNAILGSFASSIAPAEAPISTKARRSPFSTVQRRTIFQTSLRQVEAERSLSEKEVAHERTLKSDNAEDSAESATPWYLKEQPPVPDVNPFAERQRMPDIPGNAPPILEPLLKHISIDLGLDYLSIVDLRNLDPPPAFGSNLIMLFGSARSEKHLNMSADRLCRWLRTNYGLRPYADGLLGRNELKLKLKRKNRRSRILSAAGGRGMDDTDDGITTGWICVNVGTVEGGAAADGPDSTEAAQFVGFGTGSHGSKIVVQMMTEEKRGEVDLEGLWQGMLDRAERRKATNPEPTDEVDGGATSSPASSYEPSLHSQTSSPRYPQHQARGFHTFARRMTAEVSRVLESSRDEALLQGAPAVGTDLGFKPVADQLELLLNMSQADALKALGLNEHDQSTTSFLRAVNEDQPAMRSMDDMDSAIKMHCYAINVGHPGYSRGRLILLLREMQAACFQVPLATCYLALHTVLTTHSITAEENINTDTPAKEARAIVRRAFVYAREVLNIMELHGYDVATKEVFEEIHGAVAFPQFEHPNIHLMPEKLRPKSKFSPLELTKAYSSMRGIRGAPSHEFSSAVRNAVEALYQPEAADNPQGYDGSLFKFMLRSYAELKDYGSFWALWSQLPRRMLARDAEMYEIMLRCIANSEKAGTIQSNLVEYAQDMEREEPPVQISGRLAEALRDCLVAAHLRRDSGPPWSSMWRRIDDALGPSEANGI